MYLFYKKGAKGDILNWMETKGVSKQEDEVYVVNSKASRGEI